jgi:hypothetical protein
MQPMQQQIEHGTNRKLARIFSVEKLLLVGIVLLLISLHMSIKPPQIEANLSDAQVQQVLNHIGNNQPQDQVVSLQSLDDINRQLGALSESLISEISQLRLDVEKYQAEFELLQGVNVNRELEIPLEQQQQAAAQIEMRLQQAIQRGSWSALDSESIIEQVALISAQERMRLLELFAQAADQGLSSIAEYPPPL